MCMGRLLYYLLLPLIYLLSWSPSWILYRISDFLFFILYYIVGYRKKVVQLNLKNAFPEKSEQERKEIEVKHIKFLCDVLVEALKTITMKKSYVKRHLTFINMEEVHKYYDQGKSLLVVMGHYGNWELAGPCFAINSKYPLNVVYKVLSNPYAEELFVKARTKFGSQIIPMEKTLRSMTKNRTRLDVTALIADQTPADTKTGQWIKFLNQETLVFDGPEKLSKMFDKPVVFMTVDRVKRGKYEISPTFLFDKPKESEDGEITKAFFKKLEEDIIAKPEIWLWSHKRWKHKKSTISE